MAGEGVGSHSSKKLCINYITPFELFQIGFFMEEHQSPRSTPTRMGIASSYDPVDYRVKGRIIDSNNKNKSELNEDCDKIRTFS